MGSINYNNLFNEADKRIIEHQKKVKEQEDFEQKQEILKRKKKIEEETRKLSEAINDLVLDTIKNAEDKTGMVDTSKYKILGHTIKNYELGNFRKFKIAKNSSTGYTIDENGLTIILNYSSFHGGLKNDPYHLTIGEVLEDNDIDYNYLNELLNKKNIYVRVIKKESKDSINYGWEHVHIIKITVPRTLKKASSFKKRIRNLFKPNR